MSNMAFSDVPSAHWAGRYIYFLAHNGIVEGVGGGLFEPNKNVTVGELCAMAVRAADIPPVYGEIWDSQHPNMHWARKYVDYVSVERGISINGQNQSGDQDINTPIRRQYAMNILWHIVGAALGKLKQYKYDAEGFNKYVTFSDSNEIRPYNMESVYQLVRNQVVEGFPNGTLGPNDNLTRAEAGKILAFCVADKQEVEGFALLPAIGRVAISSGHGGLPTNGNGSGFRDPGAVYPRPPKIATRFEVTENRRVVKEVARLLRGMGVVVHEFHNTFGASQQENLDGIALRHNGVERHLDVQIHFNSGERPEIKGVETLHRDNRTDEHLSGRNIARRVSHAINRASGYRLHRTGGGPKDLRQDDGAAHRTNLRFLNNAENQNIRAIMPEVCYITNIHDMAAYDENFNAICQAIAEELASTAIAIAIAKSQS
jgi:N-acetylmuramoyl-L-alanine amidase